MSDRPHCETAGKRLAQLQFSVWCLYFHSQAAEYLNQILFMNSFWFHRACLVRDECLVVRLLWPTENLYCLDHNFNLMQLLNKYQIWLCFNIRYWFLEMLRKKSENINMSPLKLALFAKHVTRFTKAQLCLLKLFVSSLFVLHLGLDSLKISIVLGHFRSSCMRLSRCYINQHVLLDHCPTLIVIISPQTNCFLKILLWAWSTLQISLFVFSSYTTSCLLQKKRKNRNSSGLN